MTQLKKTNIIIFSIILLVILVVALLSLSSYQMSINKVVSNVSHTWLSEILDDQSQIMRTIFTEKINSIETISHISSLVINNGESYDRAIQVVAQLLPNNDFQDIGIVNLQGDFVASILNANYNISNRNYFLEVLEGNTIVSSFVSSVMNDTPVTVFASPIIGTNDEIIAMSIAFIDSYKFGSIVTSAFNGNSSVNITDKEGNPVFSSVTPSNNQYKYAGVHIFNHFNSDLLVIEDPYSYEELEFNIINGNKGCITYSIDGIRRQMHYEPLGINDWTISLVVLDSILTEPTKSLKTNSFILILFIVIMFTVFAIGILVTKISYSNNLYKKAYYDDLTSIPNLALFRKKLKAYIESRQTDYLAISKFDIKNFKTINEIFGYDIGDYVLKKIASTLKNLVPKFENKNKFIYARIYDDEFIIAVCCANKTEYDKYSKLIQGALRKATSELLDHRILFYEGRYILNNDDKDVNSILEKVNIVRESETRSFIP